MLEDTDSQFTVFEGHENTMHNNITCRVFGKGAENFMKSPEGKAAFRVFKESVNAYYGI